MWKCAGKYIPGRWQKTRDRKERGLFRKAKPRLLWPGSVAEDGGVDEGRIKPCRFL